MRITLLEEVTIPFSYMSELDLYGFSGSGVPLLPVVGDSYIIAWDSIEYICTAYTIDGFSDCIFIGNSGIVSMGEDTGEPFIIDIYTTTDTIEIATLSDLETHTLAIFQEVVEEKKGVDIILYNRSGVAVTYEDIVTLTTDTPTAGQVETFTHGVLLEDVEVNLNFSEGDQIVSLEKGFLLKDATIKKPEDLIPENILADKNVAGVIGSLQLPILFTPVLTKESQDYYNNISIKNPEANGNFVEELQIFINGEHFKTIENPEPGSTLVLKDLDLFDGTGGYLSYSAQAFASLFRNSLLSNVVESSVWGVTITPDTLEDGYDYPAITGGATYEGYFNQKGLGLDYLSPEIEVTMGGAPCEYTWDCDLGVGYGNNIGAGTVNRNGSLEIPNVVGDLNINIPLLKNIKLKKPQIINHGAYAEIIPAPYANVIKWFIDDVAQEDLKSIEYSVIAKDTSISTVYDFFLLQDTRTDGVTSGNYSWQKVAINALEDITVVLRCTQWLGTQTQNNYMYIGVLDVELSKSNSVDAAANIFKSYRGVSSYEKVDEIEYTIPAGEHFFCVKSRIGTTYSTNASFNINLYKACNNKKIYLSDYEEHVIKAIASHVPLAESSGNITVNDSEQVSATIKGYPLCSVEERKLLLDNIISDVKQIEIYINGNLVDTVTYVSAEEWDLDLTNYPYHNTNNQIYIKALGEEIEASSPSIEADLTVPSPTITIEGTVLSSDDIVPQVNAIELYVDDVLFTTYPYDPEVGFSQDISDALEGLDTSEPTWNVENLSTYTFELNSNGYYESQCKAVNNGYAVCKVNILNGSADSTASTKTLYIKAINTDLLIDTTSNSVSLGREPITATFNCINYAESNYDYGILSTLDKTLSISNTADSSNVQKSFKGLQSASVVPVVYTIPLGEHFVYVKYRKDSSAHKNNDSLQFTVVLS